MSCLSMAQTISDVLLCGLGWNCDADAKKIIIMIVIGTLLFKC